MRLSGMTNAFRCFRLHILASRKCRHGMSCSREGPREQDNVQGWQLGREVGSWSVGLQRCSVCSVGHQTPRIHLLIWWTSRRLCAGGHSGTTVPSPCVLWRTFHSVSGCMYRWEWRCPCGVPSRSTGSWTGFWDVVAKRLVFGGCPWPVLLLDILRVHPLCSAVLSFVRLFLWTRWGSCFGRSTADHRAWLRASPSLFCQMW